MNTRKMLKSAILVTAIASCQPTYAQGFFQKVVGKATKVIGKTMGGMLFGTTDNLSGNSPGIFYRSNIYPKKVGTIDMDMFGKNWVDGGDQILIYMLRRRGIKMNKLEGGSVMVDGQPATFQDLGIYTYAVPHSDAAHVVELTASNGEKSSFTIKPLPDQTRIVSINGQTGTEVEVDLTKDVTLELSNPGPADGATINLMLTASVIGLNTFYQVGNFKPAAKIVIPAEAFANTGFPGSQNKITSIKNAYLMVTRMKIENASSAGGQYKSVPIVNAALDGRFLKVTGRPDFTTGIKSEGTYKEGAKKMDWSFAKEEAAISRPFSQAKKIGVVAFGTRGISTAESHDNGKLSGVQSDAWASFTPGNAFLDALNTALYDGVTKATKEMTGAQIVGPEAISKTKAFEESNDMTETNEGTPNSYARAYKTDKILSEMALTVGFRPIANGQTLPDEAGVDALLRCVLDLSLKMDKGGRMTLRPILRYTLYGKPAGISLVSTKYAEGTVETKDVAVSKNTTDAELLEMISVPDMMAALRAGLMDLKEKEKSAPYEKLWGME